MSSYETYVDCNEWHEMNRRIAETGAYVIRSENERQRLEGLARAREAQTLREHAASLEAMQNAVTVLNAAFQTNLANVRNGLDRNVQESAERFSAQLNNLRTSINSTVDALGKAGNRLESMDSRLNQADSRLDNTASRLEQAGSALVQVDTHLNTLNENLEQLVQNYNAVFQECQHQLSAQSERARAVLEGLDSTLEQIRELKPERFGALALKYGELTAMRNLAASNIKSEDYGAALMVSQNGIVDSVTLLGRLIVQNGLYGNLEQRLRETAGRVRERIDRFVSGEGILSIDLNGERQEYDYDIDHWSHGNFGEIVSRFEAVCTRLNAGILTMEQLREDIRNVEMLERELDVCDEKARRARAAAIAAADMAVRMDESLERNGWDVESSGYYDGDDRNAYNMIYTDGAGNRIAMVVAPEGVSAPSVSYEAYSDSEESAEIIKEGVRSYLTEDGEVKITAEEYYDDCSLNPDAETFIENRSLRS